MGRGVLAVVMVAPWCGVSDGGATGAGGLTRCAFVGGLDENVCVTMPERESCGGRLCERGETCCFPTLKCVAPDAGTCVSPIPDSCASRFDCAEGEVCARSGGACDSLGRCEPPGRCRYDRSGLHVCGCDGRTYDSVQAACVAGVNLQGDVGACGVPDRAGNVPCGFDAQCLEGQACCGLTGFCFDVSESWRCERQTDGTVFDCDTDEQCRTADEDRFCRHSGEHGVCSSWSYVQICGERAQICDCNDVTAGDDCRARSTGVNPWAE